MLKLFFFIISIVSIVTQYSSNKYLTLHYYHTDYRVYSIVKEEIKFKILTQLPINCLRAPCPFPVLNEKTIDDGEDYAKLEALFNEIFKDSELKEKVANEVLTSQQLEVIFNIFENNNITLELKYEIINKNDFYSKQYNKRGYYNEKVEDTLICTIAMGEKTSGGYSIEIKARKIKEIKSSIRSLSLLFEQIKQFSKEKNSQSNQILENFENKFNLRLREEEEKRINLEKRLKNMIDSKFRDMKCKMYDNSKERFDELENFKNKMETQIPQLQEKTNNEKKIRKIKDEEIKEKIRDKMNNYNDIMRKEIKNREIFDDKCLDDIKYTFADFNKQMRQATFNREQSQGQLIDLVDATISQIDANRNKGE